ncbi:MAG: putative peptidoglycan glycosyltransferase FtsW [Hespellia sp.]|nr:putative peptidoglycan glycosyltransferase FtsW [Hespellia sp.]
MKKKKVTYFDYNLLVVLIFMVCFGLVLLYSASAYEAQVDWEGDSMHFFKRQALISAGSFFLMYWITKIDYHWYAKFAEKFYWVSIAVMALVLTPLGVEVNGAKRWLPLVGSLTFQPSEIAKIAVILFIPLVICRLGKDAPKPAGMIRIFGWGLAVAGAVFFFTDNLSTAIIVAGITFILFFVVHPKTKGFVIFGSLSAVAAGVAVIVMSRMIDTSGNFRIRRILVWLHPESNAADGGYQVMQGLYAIGSGGFFGKGLGNSTQKLGVIPEIQNDMILSVICEELGVFGAIVILILFGILIYRLMFIARNAPDLYGSLIATGIMAHIALQVILNIAVVTNLIPTTGVTLPFISYGGTSVVFLMAEMGIALGISKKIRISDD